jgi:hypothetical protein
MLSSGHDPQTIFQKTAIRHWNMLVQTPTYPLLAVTRVGETGVSLVAKHKPIQLGEIASPNLNIEGL